MCVVLCCIVFVIQNLNSQMNVELNVALKPKPTCVSALKTAHKQSGKVKTNKAAALLLNPVYLKLKPLCCTQTQTQSQHLR